MQDLDTKFQIPMWNVETLRKEVGKINRRCERFGWTPVHLEIGDTETLSIKHPITAIDIYYGVTWVTVEHERVGFDGWRFIATLERVGERNIMSAVPGEDVPEQYRTAPSHCDHCGTDRDRNYTYVLAHEDGTYKQVGSTCINDFLNGYNALAYAKMLSYIGGLSDTYGSVDPDELLAGEGGPRVSRGVDLHTFLSEVACAIRVEGWMSGSKSWELGLPSTKTIAINLLDPKTRKFMEEKHPGQYDGIPEDGQKATEVIEWLRSDYFDPDPRRLSDYEWNLSTAVGEDWVSWKNMGIVASAYACWDRYREVQAEVRRSKQHSEHVGELKQRLTMRVHIDLIRYFEGYYGPSTLYVMRDEDGNKLITFYSGTTFDPAEDDIVDIKATVKKHELDKNGVKQTVLTRITEVK